MKQYKAAPEIKKKVEKQSKSVFNFDIDSFSNKGGKKNIDTARNRKISSTRWLTRQINDKFFKMSKELGFNSRASFKLVEIADKYNLYNKISKAEVVVDLGCAPGGWTQIIESCILSLNSKKIPKIIALDLIDTNYITNNINFIKGDFEEIAVQEEILKIKQNLKINLIFSDIAPNNTGNQFVDRINMLRIIESILNFSNNYLEKDGSLIFKSIKGCDEMVFLNLKQLFSTVERFKPQSSRKDSSEMYIICLKKK